MNSDLLRKIHVIGGDCWNSSDPNTLFTTVLGSCVSACIYDPVRAIGGMNHFILPFGGDHVPQDAKNRYGQVAMRTLVDGLIRHGAKRERLEAKLYGGRSNNPDGAGPGVINAAFAKEFLRMEGIRLIEARLGEDLARWVCFIPATGEVKVRETSDPGALWATIPKVAGSSPTLRMAG
jgi:chemotaxis protein CheD